MKAEVKIYAKTIDEAPQAYKPMKEIIDIIKPVYNFKAQG